MEWEHKVDWIRGKYFILWHIRERILLQWQKFHDHSIKVMQIYFLWQTVSKDWHRKCYLFTLNTKNILLLDCANWRDVLLDPALSRKMLWGGERLGAIGNLRFKVYHQNFTIYQSSKVLYPKIHWVWVFTSNGTLHLSRLYCCTIPIYLAHQLVTLYKLQIGYGRTMHCMGP